MEIVVRLGQFSALACSSYLYCMTVLAYRRVAWVQPRESRRQTKGSSPRLAPLKPENSSGLSSQRSIPAVVGSVGTATSSSTISERKRFSYDLKALYAYLMTRQPVSATAPSNTVPLPLSVRALQEGWKLLLFRSGRYHPSPSKSDEWNRGAYLAEALSDCSGCHTPRNLLGGEKARDAYAGAVIDGWIAPPIDQANPSPVPWTTEELFTFLRTGASPLHGASAPP
jgi:mono/diheme cytochrome c family protein